MLLCRRRWGRKSQRMLLQRMAQLHPAVLLLLLREHYC
jgi:hypothetical protein